MSDMGELYAQIPLSDGGFAGAIDARLDVLERYDSGRQLTILPAEYGRADGRRGGRRRAVSVWL
ncbi:MAG: hypothetical protein ACLUHE_15325 [Christensenellales bacterium]